MVEFSFWKKSKDRRLSIIDTVFVYISIVTLVNIILLATNSFYPLVSLASGFLILLITFNVFKIGVKFEDRRFNWLFLLVLLVTLSLRLTPNLYITGGQDQGTYVSLSKQYDINHGLYIEDELRESLSEKAKNLYDISGAATMLGVEEMDKDASIFYMPFYPSLPSWMSIFASLFGSDNRIYALTMFGVLSVVATYLFAYEISDKNKNIALLASFFVGINPLHVYFSRIPLTEVVSLSFLLFFLYSLTKFYKDSREGKDVKIYLLISILSANALFYTRMSSLLLLPFVLLVPLLSLLFENDKKLRKQLTSYSLAWIVSLGISYLYYFLLIPSLFSSIFEGRVLTLLGSNNIIIVGIVIVLLISGLFLNPIREFTRTVSLFLHKNIFPIFIVVFSGLILYEFVPYVLDILIKGGSQIFSFESLSYLKQLSFIATFLYLSPLGFILVPVAFYYIKKKENVESSLLIFLVMIFLVYCWGILRLTPYHYYFVRYQVSELVPFCLIALSVFLVGISSKGTIAKILSICVITSISIYSGYFAIIQLRDFEGADRDRFEELQSIVDEDDLLLVANNDFGSAQQIVFPIKYYYGINTFLLYTSSYIDNQEIIDLKEEYQDVYILMKDPDFEQKNIKLVKEIKFKHNYLVHCNRDEDAYFEMEGHSKDIPFCRYIIIPNRYYYGVYVMYLYLWE